VFATDHYNRHLYQIDPTQQGGPVTTVASNLGIRATQMAFDGTRIWINNGGSSDTAMDGSVSIVSLNPISVITTHAGFLTPNGVIFDGANVWVSDVGDNSLKKLDANGAVILSVPVGAAAAWPCFDGTNIWVPNSGDNSLTVVRSSTGRVVATLLGNGLNFPIQVAFDGQRVLATNFFGGSVSLWQATSLSPIGSYQLQSARAGAACSDGINFWITLPVDNQLVRF
jgi:hypothetical protein